MSSPGNLLEQRVSDVGERALIERIRMRVPPPPAGLRPPPGRALPVESTFVVATPVTTESPTESCPETTCVNRPSEIPV